MRIRQFASCNTKRPMLRYVVIVACLILLAVPSPAHDSDKACTVEGNTSRWAMSYCMTRFETDDDAHPGVSACYIKELKQKLAHGPEEDCDANLAYKSAICSILIEFRINEQSLAGCIASDEIVPSVVTNGID